MKIYFLVLLLLCKADPVFPQPKLSVDSLQNLLRVAKEDTSRIIFIAQISSEFVFYNPDSAFKLAGQALKLAQEINYSKGELYCQTTLGKLWWSIGDYPTALRFLLPAIKKPESLTDPWLRINVWAFITATYRDQGDWQEALQYAFKFNFVEKHYGQCKLCRSCYAATASIYLEMGRLDSALSYLHRAFSFPPVFGDDGWLNLIAGRTQAGLNNYDSAFYFYRQAVKTLALEENQKDLAGAYNNIAALFKKSNQSDSAFFYVRKALNISLSMRYSREFMVTCLLLSEAYEPLNPDSALHYHKLAMVAKDSLYNQEKQRQIIGYKFNEEFYQQEIRHTQQEYNSRLKMYVLIAALGAFVVFAIILFRNNQQKQKARIKIEQAYKELKATQSQLIQSEKMASLGELTAGIAHEIQNPLNFVNNFSEVNRDLLAEMKDEIDKGNLNEAKTIANNVIENQEKINQHGKRADAIVKGMLQHSRTSSGQKELTDINALADEYLRLAYHGLRAKDKTFNAKFETDFDSSIEKMDVVPQDIGRVILNLINNAFYSISEKQKQDIAGYEPTLIVSTKRVNDKIEIRIKDNGNGIPQRVMDKIFQPFFTTKPTGQGTGLGLSLAYDIITKGHSGELKVENREQQGAVFIIILPVI